jgi:hypothetical protein
MAESTTGIESKTPHGIAMEILQEQYKADHPYRSVFSPLTYDDIKEDPALSAEYARIVDLINKTQSGEFDHTISTCPFAKGNEAAENPNCKSSGLKISKAERKFDLVITKPNSRTGALGEDNVLEVVGGSMLAKPVITGEISGLVVNCSTHKNKKNWNIPHGKIKSLTPNYAEIVLASELKPRLLVWNAEPKVYYLSANTCSNTYGALVKVYPDIECDASFSIDLSGESKKISEDSTTVKYGEVKSKKQGQTLAGEKHRNTSIYEEFTITNGISISANYKKDGVQLSFKKTFAQIIQEIQRLETIRNGVDSFLEKIAGKSKSAVKRRKDKIDAATEKESYQSSKSMQSSAPQDSVSITYPNITIGIGGKWEELEGDYRVDCAGTAEFGFNPLIKLGVKKDISSFILKTTPAGTALSKVKEALKDMEIETLALIFEVSGELSGKVKHYAYTLKDSHTDGEVSLKIPVSVTAVLLKTSKNIESKYLKSYVLKIEIDVSAKGESGIQFDGKLTEDAKNKSLAFEISGQFLGIEVSVTAVINSSIEDKQKPPDGYIPVDERHDQKEWTKIAPGKAVKDGNATSGGVNYKHTLYKMDKAELFKKTINF